MDIKTQKMLADVVLNAQNKTVKPYTTTATVKSVNNGIVYVEIPGSDRDTPVKNSSVSVKKGDVVDLVVSHSDTHITGNRSDVAVPASTAHKMFQAFEATRLEMDNKLDLVGNDIEMINNNIVMQDNEIEMQNSTIKAISSTLEAQSSDIEVINTTLNAQGSDIDVINTTLEAQSSNIEVIGSKINTQESKIEALNSTVETQESVIETLNSTVETQSSTIETIGSTLNTHNSAIETINSKVTTHDSDISSLNSSVRILNTAFVIKNGTLTGISQIITDILDSGYVTTDFLNADVAWIEDGKIKQGAIGTVEIADSSITTAKIAELSADVIKTGTLKTECLILTTDEVDPVTGETKYALITALNAKTQAGEGNILDGAVIADDTIEASKITVVDLNAFGATIGNFHIGTSSMYNGKTSLKDPTNGVYIGTDGIALGQGSLLGMTDDSPFRVESNGEFHLGGQNNNYINFDPFSRKLEISAESIKIGSKSVADYFDDSEFGGRNLILNSETLASDEHTLCTNVLTYKGSLLTYKGELLTL